MGDRSMQYIDQFYWDKSMDFESRCDADIHKHWHNVVSDDIYPNDPQDYYPMGNLLPQHDPFIYCSKCCDLFVDHDFILAYMGHAMSIVHHGDADGIDILFAFYTMAMLMPSWSFCSILVSGPIEKENPDDENINILQVWYLNRFST